MMLKEIPQTLDLHHPGWRSTAGFTRFARLFSAANNAFTILQKDRVISLVRPDNHASIRLVERLGERPEGRTVLAGTEYLVYGIERAGS